MKEKVKIDSPTLYRLYSVVKFLNDYLKWIKDHYGNPYVSHANYYGNKPYIGNTFMSLGEISTHDLVMRFNELHAYTRSLEHSRSGSHIKNERDEMELLSRLNSIVQYMLNNKIHRLSDSGQEELFHNILTPVDGVYRLVRKIVNEEGEW